MMKSVTQIEHERPWTSQRQQAFGSQVSRSSFATARAGFASRPGADVAGIQARPLTPALDDPFSRAVTPGDRPLSGQTTWIAIPATRHYEAVGLPGPGSRRGRAETSYTYSRKMPTGYGSLSQSPTSSHVGHPQNVLSMQSMDASGPPKTPLSAAGSRPSPGSSAMSSFSTGPTARTLRLEAMAAQRRDATTGRQSTPFAYRVESPSPQGGLSKVDPMTRDPEPWKSAASIGYGDKAFYMQ